MQSIASDGALMIEQACVTEFMTKILDMNFSEKGSVLCSAPDFRRDNRSLSLRSDQEYPWWRWQRDRAPAPSRPAARGARCAS